eukprot:922010-Prorocentrum_minimum.AAC.1
MHKRRGSIHQHGGGRFTSGGGSIHSAEGVNAQAEGGQFTSTARLRNAWKRGCPSTSVILDSAWIASRALRSMSSLRSTWRTIEYNKRLLRK